MHKTVVRNKAYQTKSFTTVERHNERKNEDVFDKRSVGRRDFSVAVNVSIVTASAALRIRSAADAVCGINGVDPSANCVCRSVKADSLLPCPIRGKSPGRVPLDFQIRRRGRRRSRHAHAGRRRLFADFLRRKESVNFLRDCVRF